MKDVIFYSWSGFFLNTHTFALEMTNSLSLHCDKRSIQGVAIYHIHIDPDSTWKNILLLWYIGNLIEIFVTDNIKTFNHRVSWTFKAKPS